MKSINTHKETWYVSTVTDVFLNHKRVNVRKHMMSLYCEFTYIYYLLFEKDLCECLKVGLLFNFPCVYLYLSYGEFIFFGNSFLSPFWVIHISVLSLSTWSKNNIFRT